MSADWVVVGTVGRAHGLRGEVEVWGLSDDTLDAGVLDSGRTFSRPDGSELTVRSTRRHHQKLLVGFDEVPDRSVAEALRGTELKIPSHQRRTLGADEYWPEDLVGLPVFDTTGGELGVVIDLVVGGAQDRLVVDTPAGTREVPFVAAIVPVVDTTGGRIVVDPPEGLL